MSSSTFNIGVLGAGQIAQAAHPDRRAQGQDGAPVCNLRRSRLTCARRMAAVHQPTTTFADYDAMLADDNVDAVIVAVADQFHVPLCRSKLYRPASTCWSRSRWPRQWRMPRRCYRSAKLPIGWCWLAP